MTEEQTMLWDTADRYLRDHTDFNQRRDQIAEAIYNQPEKWQAFAEMGWLAMPFPESLDGLNFGLREIAILAELCGQYLVTEPLIDALAVASTVLIRSEQAATLVPGVISGDLIAIAAIDEPTAGSRLSPSCTLSQTDSGWRLQGKKYWISAGASATHFAVLADSSNGLAWVLVAKNAAGLSCETFPTHDGKGGANCHFDLPISDDQILLSGDAAAEALSAFRECAMILSSAETLGAAQAALDTTVDYTKQREQFGQPLASFQALQHRMANMLIQTELTRSLVYSACDAADHDSPDRGRFARAAKVKSAAVGRKVTQEAIQLHGGIATTDEYIVGHFFKRVTALETWVCSKGEALQEFIALDAKKVASANSASRH